MVLVFTNVKKIITTLTAIKIKPKRHSLQNPNYK